MKVAGASSSHVQEREQDAPTIHWEIAPYAA